MTVSDLLHQEYKKKLNYSYDNQPEITSYVCVLLVVGKTGRILEEKRELAKRGTDDDNGARRGRGGVE